MLDRQENYGCFCYFCGSPAGQFHRIESWLLVDLGFIPLSQSFPNVGFQNFFSSLCMFVVCVYRFVWVHLPVSAHVRDGGHWMSSFPCHSSFTWDTLSHWTWRSLLWLGWLTSKPQCRDFLLSARIWPWVLTACRTSTLTQWAIYNSFFSCF